MCLTATSPATLTPCNSSDARQIWREYFGFYNAASLCLSPLVAEPYCNGTFCPRAGVRPVAEGTPLGAVNCGLGGEQEQYFDTVLSETGASNLQPDSWATAALAGNGLIGVRLQTMQGAPAVLQMTMDNNNLGRGKQRLSVGSFVFNFTALYAASNGSLVVKMRQNLYNASISVNISAIDTPDVPLATMDVFVHANRSLPVVVVSIWHNAKDTKMAAGPAVLWVTQPAPGATTDLVERDGVWLAGQNISDGPHYVAGWLNKTLDGGSTVNFFATVVLSPQPQSDAIALLTKAASLGRETLLQSHRAWWQTDFWPAAVVSLGATFVESYYQLALAHYAGADQVGVHGLDGAFGPTGMCNYWSDDVWDMNEQVGTGVAPDSQNSTPLFCLGCHQLELDPTPHFPRFKSVLLHSTLGDGLADPCRKQAFSC